MPSRNPRKRQHSSGSQSAKMCQIKIGKSQSEWECLGTLVGTKLAQKTVYELTVEFSTGSEVITMSTSRAGTILSRDGAPCLWDEFEGDQVASVCFHDKQLHEAVAAQFNERRVATTEPEEIDSVSDVDDDTAPWRLATELESVREEVAGLRHLQRDMAELRSMLAGLQASFDAKNTSPASPVAASPSAGAVQDPVLATPAVDTPAEDLSTAADNFYEMDITTWKPILMKLSSFERRQYLSEKLLAQDSAHQRFQRRPFSNAPTFGRRRVQLQRVVGTPLNKVVVAEPYCHSLFLQAPGLVWWFPQGARLSGRAGT
eukprot:gene7746-biopygen5199